MKNTGNSKIKISKIAERAGVSPATVSRVLNRRSIVSEDTRAKVTAAMRELGCEAYSIPTSRDIDPSGLILIIIPPSPTTFFHEVISGIKVSINRFGLSCLLMNELVTENNITAIMKQIKQHHIIGVISMIAISPQLLNQLAGITTVVQCCEYTEDTDVPYVSINNYEGARLAVNHLISLGRKRIAFINNGTDNLYARQRLQGYVDTLEKAGLKKSPELIIQLSELNLDLVTSATIQLLDSENPPDGIFLVSDVYGSAVLRGCHLCKKRVPEDIAVVGFDNLDTSKFLIPSLSSIEQPKTQIGYLAAEALFEKILNPMSPKKELLLEPELVLRESSSVIK